MKLNRAEFLTAALALATASGCNKLKTELGQASPENPPAAQQPAAGQAAPAQGDNAATAAEAPPRPDTDDTTGQGTGQATGAKSTLRSHTKEAGTLASPTKAGLASPTKEAGLASPTKEAGLASPTKEAGVKPSPVKETGLASPVKEAGAKKPPSPVKEM